MTDHSKKKLQRATLVYWVLLSYIVAALVWWFISLEKQNSEMTDFRLQHLNKISGLSHTSAAYQNELRIIYKARDRNSWKYIGEGGTFLLLILIGAAFVYRSVRRQLRLQRQQQNFMMAVTHELKTPIAVAKLNLETLQKYSLDPVKQQKIIAMTLQETTRLNDLTNNILISSQLEGGGYKLTKEELNLSDLVQDSIQDFRHRYPERIFRTDITPEIEMKGDAILLQMLINNLVENAIKYSPKDKSVNCILQRHQQKIMLIIIDEGEGIADEEKQKIFEKFYRVGNELTRKAHGTGLGLYLCRKIAHDHHASIKITDNIPRGSKFIITFNT
ncbi:MAG TPA: ATP-binding protein [Chitinophagaceae bacterium]|jgi:Osmosensitive K+ channel histidine kinase